MLHGGNGGMSGNSSGPSNKLHSRTKCKATTKTGERCRAWAIGNGPFCTFHSVGERIRWRVKMGCRRGGAIGRTKIDASKLPEVKTKEDIIKVLNILIKDVYSRKLSGKDAQAITTALGGIKTVLESPMPSDASSESSRVAVVLPHNDRDLIPPGTSILRGPSPAEVEEEGG